MTQRPITEADLHAYVDGVFPQSRRAEIDAYLAQQPEEAKRLQAYRQQKEDLRALFNPVMDEPIPISILSRPSHRSWSMQRIAASLAIAMVSGAAGWLLHGEATLELLAQSPMSRLAENARVPALVRQAAIAHVVYSPDVRHPVEIGADQEEQLVTWLSKRLGTPIRPPKLSKLGYELIGGRLLPGQTGPVAQFMYQGAGSHRLTLYVSTEQSHNKDTGFRFAEEGPINVFYWIDGKFGYVLSAGIRKAELSRIATAVYEQLKKS
jgi:anti-sigma factor RsiW